MSGKRYMALFGAAAFAASLCLADDTADAQKKERKRPDMGQIDTNGDGKASFEEVKAKFPGITEEKFKARDKNGDGFLTPDERGTGGPKPTPDVAQAAVKREPGQIFKQADKDGDGKVTWEEVHAAAPRFPQERFKQLDANADGALTEDELPTAVAKAGAPSEKPRDPGLFQRADKNNDGKVTFEEASAAVPSMTREKFEKLDKNKDGAVAADEVPKPGDVSGKKPDIAQLARRADTDNNGKVTFDEMRAVMPKLDRARFDEMDRNKDGVLSPEDRAQAEREGKQGAGEAGAKLMESDANKDGKLTYEELTAAKPGFPREAFDKADRNKDGVLSAEDQARK